MDYMEIMRPWEEDAYKYLSNGKVFAVGVEGYEVYPDLENLKMVKIVRGKVCQYLVKDFWVYKRQEEPLLMPDFFKNKFLYGEAYLQFVMQANGLRLGTLSDDLVKQKPSERAVSDKVEDTMKFLKKKFMGKLSFTKKKGKKYETRSSV